MIHTPSTTWIKLVALVVALCTVLYCAHYSVRPSRVVHPVFELLDKGEREMARRRASQPTTYDEAVQLYRHKHDRLPPDGYRDWFETARRINACHVAGYDDLYADLEIWHAISSQEIKTKTEQLIGTSSLGRVSVRRGKLRTSQEMDKEVPGSSGLWSDAQQTMNQILARILLEWDVQLPDFDMIINGLDESRVALPYEERQQLRAMAKAGKVRPPVNESLELRSFGGFVTRDGALRQSCPSPNSYCPTSWAGLRHTCPPSSLAQTASLSLSPGSNPIISQRYTSEFTTRRGHFLISPDIEQSTWCDQPDLQDLHAAFIHPLTWTWTKQPYPIFTNSKIRGYDDILVPAWFYWQERSKYEVKKDVEWSEKKDGLYWLGTNTGGYSIGMTYKGWIRARAVSQSNTPPHWNHHSQVVLADSYGKTISTTLPTHAINAGYLDVALVGPDHGDEDSRAAQLAEPSFRFVDFAPFERQYSTKATLDLDGTAYSGRFLSLMKSRTAVFKSAMYREALSDTLVPWYHYIPVSTRLAELPSLVGFFFGVQRATRQALLEEHDVDDRLFDVVAHDAELRKVAEQGTEWADTCGRKEEAMLYVYLLALEWGRIWNRET